MRLAGHLAAIGLLLVTAACGSLPDATPFFQSTVHLRSAIAAAGTAVDSELRATDVLRESADRLAPEWAKNVSAADALVAYSESLVAITDAGNSGGESARALANSLNGLAAGVGIAAPSAAAVSTATDIAAFLYQQIALVRASRNLQEALSTAQPAVDQIAKLLGANIKSMEVILVTAADAADKSLQLKRENQIQLGYLQEIRDEQERIYRTAATDPKSVARLAELDKAIEAMRDWREPYEAARKAIATRLAVSRQLISATQQGIFDWAATHRQLATALAEGRRINPEALAQSVVEIRELVRKVRAL